MPDKKYAIEVNNVKKSFYLPKHKNDSLKSAITQMFKSKDKGVNEFNALDGVSFKVEKGDFFGILGRNGSGKSTLLKIISEIYQPTSGSVKHDGKIVAFIELGVGFKPELSGRENVFLNGALLGFSKKEIKHMYDDIVEFAELDRFMDQKLKNYSSGMKVRLAFSVAIRAKADILVLDEVLAVGDADFQRKCYNYFAELKDAKKTIIFVTHSMGQVRQFCNKAILIEGGKITHEGDAKDVADEYTKLFIKPDTKPQESEVDSGKQPSISAEIIGNIHLKNTDHLRISVKYRNVNDREVYPKVVIYHKRVPIIGVNAKIMHGIVTSDNKEHLVTYTLPLNGFNQGEASISALLVDSKEEVNIARFGFDNELTFSVENTKTGQKIGGIITDTGSMELQK